MQQRCCVCGETLDPDNMSQCNLCGGYFHMAWSVKARVKECGHYWMNEQYCSLAFICALCEEKLPASGESIP